MALFLKRFPHLIGILLGLSGLALFLPFSPVNVLPEGADYTDQRGQVERFNPSAGASMDFGSPRDVLVALGIPFEEKLLRPPTATQIGDYTPGGLNPRGIVIHNSDSPSYLGCGPLYNSFVAESRLASSHFCIDTGGKVYQYVPTGSIAWHSTLQQYSPTIPLLVEIDQNGLWLNQHVWGIELALDYDPDTEYAEDYPDMIRSLTVLVKWLVQQGGIVPDRLHVITHNDTDAVNRVDPVCCWRRYGMAAGAAAFDEWVAGLGERNPDPAGEESFELRWLRDVQLKIIRAALDGDYLTIRRVLDYLDLGREP